MNPKRPENGCAPEPAPRFERFRVVYPSGTVIEAYYGPDGAPLEEVTHPMATVEPIEKEP